MMKELKKQAKSIIRGNKSLFFLSVLLFTLGQAVQLTKPFWGGFCSRTAAFVLLQLINFILFPLGLGFIKLLFRTKETQRVHVKELFYIFRSPALLLKSAGLFFVTSLLINITIFLNNASPAAIKKPADFLLAIAAIALAVIFVLARYLFVFKPDLKLSSILKQSVQFILGKIWSCLLLGLTFIFWLIPGIFLLIAAGQPGNALSIPYVICLGLYLLYMGGVALYYDLTLLLFAEKIILGDYSTPHRLERFMQTYHQDNALPGVIDETELPYNAEPELYVKETLFQENRPLPGEHFSFTDQTADIRAYDVDARFDTYEIHYFLKEYGKIHDLFRKTYSGAAYNYDIIGDTDVIESENAVRLNNNDFRLVISLCNDTGSDQYQIKFGFYINS